MLRSKTCWYLPTRHGWKSPSIFRMPVPLPFPKSMTAHHANIDFPSGPELLALPVVWAHIHNSPPHTPSRQLSSQSLSFRPPLPLEGSFQVQPWSGPVPHPSCLSPHGFLQLEIILKNFIGKSFHNPAPTDLSRLIFQQSPRSSPHTWSNDPGRLKNHTLLHNHYPVLCFHTIPHTQKAFLPHLHLESQSHLHPIQLSPHKLTIHRCPEKVNCGSL